MAEPFGIEKEFVQGGLTKPLSPDSSLVASKCKKCGKLHFPSQRLCSQCYSWEEMEDVALSRRGKVFSWTISYMMGEHPIGYVDLPEGIYLESNVRCPWCKECPGCKKRKAKLNKLAPRVKRKRRT